MDRSSHLPHITSYSLAQASEPRELAKKIEAAIHDGWQPYGSIAVTHAENGTEFVQPIVRYAEWYS